MLATKDSGFVTESSKWLRCFGRNLKRSEPSADLRAQPTIIAGVGKILGLGGDIKYGSVKVGSASIKFGSGIGIGTSQSSVFWPVQKTPRMQEPIIVIQSS